ncbi:hypothetical protein J437_LFUL018770 [Ladona fulva]|uniref:SPEF2 C-terminal domain-containing protein n=1 Tax=Ladona fulva TaxID=123851 RepID=A0A8K0KSY5_LADFU|nr:hypothetical protein J437_LFUL018770 [Ladona fulva]
MTQALTLPKPTVGDLVDAVNRFRQLDASQSGSLPFEDYCNVILWFEREGEMGDRRQRMVKMPYSLEMPTKSQWKRSKLPAKFKISAQKATEEKQRGDFMDTYKEETLNLRSQNIKYPSLEKGIQKTLDDPRRVHRLIESNKYISQELLLAYSSLPKRVQSEPKGMTSGERMIANGRHSKTGIKCEEIPTEIAASSCEMKREFECSKEDEQKKEIGNGEKMKSRRSKRNGCLSDTTIVQIKMVKRQLFETFREKNGRVNYVALLLAFCKDEDAEEGLRKAISLYAGKIVHKKHDVVNNTMMRFFKRRGLLGESGKMAVHPAEQWTIDKDNKKRILGEDLTRNEMARDDAETSESMDLHSSSLHSHVIVPEGTKNDYLTVSMHNKLNIDELERKQLDRNPGYTLINTSTVASTAKLRVELCKKLGQFQCHQPMRAFKSRSIGHLDLEEIKLHTIHKFHSDSSKGREDPSELRKYHLEENLDVSESSCLMPTQALTNIVEESLWQHMDPSVTSAPSTEIGKSQYQQEKSTTSIRSESCVQWKELPREENCWSAHGMQHSHIERDDSLQELSSGIVLDRKMSKMSLTGSRVESTLEAADVHLEEGPSIHEKKQTVILSKVELQKVGPPPAESVPMRHKQCHIGEDESVGMANPLTATMDLAAKGLKDGQKALQGQETKTNLMENWTFLKRRHDTAATILIVDLKNPQRLWLGKRSGCQECDESLPLRIFTLKETKGGNWARKEEESVGKSDVVKEVLEEMELGTWHKFKMHIVFQLIRDCLKKLSPEISEDNSNISNYYRKIADILRNYEENKCYLQQEIDLSYLKTFSIFKTFQKLNMFKQLDVNGIIRKMVMKHFNDNIQKGE